LNSFPFYDGQSLWITWK